MIRPGQVGDLPAITRIRTAVTENHLSVEGMAERGITQESIAAEMREGHLGCWVALEAGDIAGFSMADRRDGSIFALFMAAAHEGKGHGAALLAACEDWLRQHGHAEARLSTERKSRAFAFYLRRGWREANMERGEDADLVKTL